jgi:DNA-binding CsgD family transcriptional regulator
MMTHVRRASPLTSVFPGRVLWAILHAIDDEDLGAGARAEYREGTAPYGLRSFELCALLLDGIALGRRGEGDAATTLVGPALAELTSRRMGRGYAYSYSLVLARAAVRDGWGEPVRWLRAAEAFFAAGGYQRLARRCRTMLGEAGAPVPRRGRGESEVPPGLRALGVTSREVDVLKLVATGRTNKDIAAELFLSPKTVERHLSNLFVRLDVRNRQALAEIAAAQLGDGSR